MNLASEREMSETMPIVIMVIVVVIFVGILGFAYERQKSDERRQWAENRGFDFTESDRDLGRRTGRLFRIGGATARDVLRIPTRAGEALYYELVWTESYGDDRRTEACAILRYPLPGPLPLMRIKPEGVFGLANNDLTAEWQEFNREFDVKNGRRTRGPGRFDQARAGVPYGSSARRALGIRRRRRLPLD